MPQPGLVHGDPWVSAYLSVKWVWARHQLGRVAGGDPQPPEQSCSSLPYITLSIRFVRCVEMAGRAQSGRPRLSLYALYLPGSAPHRLRSSGCFLGQQGLCLLSKGGGRGLPRGTRPKDGWSPNRIGATSFKKWLVLVWPACGAGATGGQEGVAEHPAAGPRIPLAATPVPAGIGQEGATWSRPTWTTAVACAGPYLE